MKPEGANPKVKEMVLHAWNILPKDVVVANSLEGSKRRPDTYLEEEIY